MASKEQLKQMIDERMAVIRKVMEFVDKVVLKIGECVSREEYSDHIKQVWKLKNFNGFSFDCVFGMTYCGGNIIKVFRENNNDPLCPVLSFYYQIAVDDARDVVFSAATEWVAELEHVFSHADEIIAQRHEARKAQQEAAESNRREQVEMRALVKQARRLGLKA